MTPRTARLDFEHNVLFHVSNQGEIDFARCSHEAISIDEPPPSSELPSVSPRLTAAAPGGRLWEHLRKEAKALEDEVEGKLSALAKLTSGIEYGGADPQGLGQGEPPCSLPPS
jgi:hypothetical protein